MTKDMTLAPNISLLFQYFTKFFTLAKTRVIFLLYKLLSSMLYDPILDIYIICMKT